MSKMIMNSREDLIVWVDIETTGLDENECLPIELGILLTDMDLEPVGGFRRIIQWGPLDWGGDVSQYVTDMHTTSGLRAEYEMPAGFACDEVERAAIQFLERSDATMLPMAGSNVANFDRRWIAKFMPNLNDSFHYRNIDCSTIKETCRRWNPEVYAKLPPKNEIHRVHEDCLDTIEEFRFYRDNFFFTTR